MRRKTAEDYESLGKRHGFQWVGSTAPDSMLDLTLWKCKKGHMFEMRGANVHMGRACPFCTRRWRRRVDDYRRLGQTHGLAWVGSEIPANIREPTHWALEDGRVVKLSYRSLAVRKRPVAELGEARIEELVVGVFKQSVLEETTDEQGNIGVREPQA